MLMNTGDKPVASQNNLLTTIGWGLGGKVTYCLEGSVFIAGAVVQWLRDGLGIIRDFGRRRAAGRQRARLAAASTSCRPSSGWARRIGTPTPAARSSASRAARRPAHIARAAVESMAYQTRDVLEAMQKDAGIELAELKVDGGASVNDAADAVPGRHAGRERAPAGRGRNHGLGAAYLAGLAVGYWNDTADIARNWALDREFQPTMSRAPASVLPPLARGRPPLAELGAAVRARKTSSGLDG